MIDDKLLDYATDAEARCLKAVNKHGSNQKAAKALGLGRRTVDKALERLRTRAAKQGYAPEYDMTRSVPDGFHLKGTSTLYDADGNQKIQWVKSSIDRERQREIFEEAVRGMAETLPKLPKRKFTLQNINHDLLSIYPIGDAHIGMLSWPQETGEDWNLELAEQIHCDAMENLVDRSPASGKAVVINLGDWFHADNMQGVTQRSGHSLDMDGRYAKMVAVGVKVMRQCIESALKKHEKVHVINVIGNHDDTGAMFLSICLANVYENEPRVTVDTAPSAFHYVRHGKVLIGCHHGHSCKPEALPGVMATDRAKDWGESEYRYWYIGHVHHQALKEYAGVTVESFRTLAAKDAYAHWGGYRAQRDMKCIVHHKELGEVSRIHVRPEMLKGAA